MRYLLFALMFGLALPYSRSQSVNWSENVACIIFDNCAGCHNTGGIAPFSLLSYEDAKLYSNAIKSVISDGEMPPWPPDPDYNALADERLLTDEEVQTILDWIDGGTPSGDLGAAPAPPTFSSTEAITQPDLVVQLPKYTSKAVSGDEYRCFVVPSDLLSDHFITGFEVIPGNRNIVHHVLIFQDAGNQPLTNDANDPDAGYLCFGGVGSLTAKMIGAWVPGQGVQFMPEGMGIKLPAKSNIVVQLHYPEGSVGEEDDTKVNFKLSQASDLREVSVDFVLNHFTSMVNGPLYIPANTVKTFNQEFEVPVPVTVMGIAPHMHLIGKSIKSWAEKPDGTVIPLIDIPHWDFEWQGFYRFEKPVTLPTGSMLKAEAVYDNTTDNHHNPNNPPQPVSLGEATTDEMMLVAFTWMNYQNGDEDLSLATASPNSGYSCNAVSTGAPEVRTDQQALRVFPNPAGRKIRIQLENEWRGALSFQVFNILGQPLISNSLEKNGRLGNWEADLSKVPPGVYQIVISNGREIYAQKLIRN